MHELLSLLSPPSYSFRNRLRDFSFFFYFLSLFSGGQTRTLISSPSSKSLFPLLLAIPSFLSKFFSVFKKRSPRPKLTYLALHRLNLLSLSFAILWRSFGGRKEEEALSTTISNASHKTPSSSRGVLTSAGLTLGMMKEGGGASSQTQKMGV